MEKNALLKIIQDDIQELELLVSTFKIEDNISEGYIKLAQKKSQSISEKLSLLSSTSSNKAVSTKSDNTQIITELQKKQIETPEKPVAKETKIEAEIKENIVPEVKVEKKEVVIEKTVKKEPKLSTKSSENKSTKPNSVIGEVLGKENKSLNEQLATSVSNSDTKYKSAVSDLKKAIGVNDRFLFIRELFNNNTEIYNQVIEQINDMQDISSATQFIKANFNWDLEDDTVKIFMDLVNRRFKK